MKIMKPYFLHDGTVQSGPFSLEELEQKKITGDALVWKAGMPDWVSAQNVDELKGLFATEAAPPVFRQKPKIPNSPKEEKSTLAVPNKEIENPLGNPKKKFFIIGGILILFAGIGLFWFFKNKSKNEIAASPVIALAKDSVTKKETIKKDTTQELSMDSLSSLLSYDSTKTSKKTDSVEQGGFAIGGMSVQKEKPASNDQPSKKEKKSTPKPEQKSKQNERLVREENRQQAAEIKNLIISGTFRKNLLLEAVLEGFIRNPNNQVSFHNIIVTATFLNAEGEQTGSQQFHKSGVLPAGGNTSFKFKTNAPKGSKSVRYGVSATSIN